MLRAIAAAAEEGADLLDRRSAGEHPYVVGWARAAMVILQWFGRGEEVGVRTDRAHADYLKAHVRSGLRSG